MSTFPTTFDASAAPSYELARALAGRYRDGDHDLGRSSAVARMRRLLDGLKKRRS